RRRERGFSSGILVLPNRTSPFSSTGKPPMLKENRRIQPCEREQTSMNRPDRWTVAGREITTEEIQTRLLIDGTWWETAHRLAQEAFIRQLAEQEGIVVAQEEGQQAVDSFRQQHGLLQAEETLQWLKEQGLTVDQLGSYCEITVLREKLKSKLFSD